ncbi:MAG: hypothetical protein B7X82_14490 [Hydrogenophilales bacterium 17-64-65]|nr:MAG: hypothetical protein B7X82_14490 [Hydrogenophilales bacterium 17-64-65]
MTEIVMLDTISTTTTLALLLAQVSGRLSIKLDEACALFDGTTAKSYRNKKSLGREPFPSFGHPLHVDLRDVAAAIDARRAGAKAAPRVVASASAPKKRGRPTKAEAARRSAAAQEGGAV